MTLSGNQQPVRTEITEAAMELGAEVSENGFLTHGFQFFGNLSSICLLFLGNPTV